MLHRLAIMSKDGDWIAREDEEALGHILDVLARHGARYRFGAPLDARWLAGGWSSHFEFTHDTLRARTDFSSRPPRVAPDRLQRLWVDEEGRDPAFVDARTLAEMKKTNREKDYAVLGELARIMLDPRDQLLCSRSARDLIELGRAHPELAAELVTERHLLGQLAAGRERLEVELDAERRGLMRTNEARLGRYRDASAQWAELWPALSHDLRELPLRAAHERVVESANGVLPFEVQGS